MGCAGGAAVLAAILVRLLSRITAVAQMGTAALRIVAVAQPFMAINHTLAGGLRGAGDTRWTMYITGASAWGVRVALTYVLVSIMKLGLNGAWYAMVADLIMRSMLFRMRFATGKWKDTS